MQTGNEKDSKVVSLADRTSQSTKEGASATSQAKEDANFDWDTVMKRNADNASRMKNDRNKANKGVIRSYRLKH
jgi:hypothetical protein